MVLINPKKYNPDWPILIRFNIANKVFAQISDPTPVRGWKLNANQSLDSNHFLFSNNSCFKLELLWNGDLVSNKSK